MAIRRIGGRETWHRLREWDKAQSESERLASRLLASNGYSLIDPSHPLGGPDGGQDIRCRNDQGLVCIVAVYFPRGQVRDGELSKKLASDLTKARALEVQGIVFFTNQEMTLSKRAKFEDSAGEMSIDIFHLERVASCLDNPSGYGLRLEFLSIEMTKEEQLSYFNARDEVLFEVRDSLKELVGSAKRKREPGKTSELLTATVDPATPYRSVMDMMFGSKLLECKKCGEVFRAQRNRAVNLVIEQELETVACPHCGKVMAFK